MARFVYAKVYCDILRHPLFRSRPDFETKLVLGLILEAKEHTEDGVLRKLTAEDARALCHIKASAQKVQEALDYLVSVGWLIPHPELAYEIKDFLPRQEADSAADRMARWREAHPVTKRNEDAKRNSYEAVTKRNAVRNAASPDQEGEEDQEKNLKALSAAPPAVSEAVKVFEEWKRILGKNGSAIFTPEREKKVKARLKEGYTVERLCKAIRGCKASPHHQGQNDTGTVYDDLELICRDGKHVETFEGFEDRSLRPAAQRNAPLQISEQSKAQAATPGRKFV